MVKTEYTVSGELLCIYFASPNKTEMNTSNIRADLEKYGIIDVREVYYNLSFDELFRHETNPDCRDMRGICNRIRCDSCRYSIFTGRSPKINILLKKRHLKNMYGGKMIGGKHLITNPYLWKSGMV